MLNNNYKNEAMNLMDQTINKKAMKKCKCIIVI